MIYPARCSAARRQWRSKNNRMDARYPKQHRVARVNGTVNHLKCYR